MKILVSICFLSISLAFGQEPTTTLHNCSLLGQSDGVGGYNKFSESYKCDEGSMKLQGEWASVMADGYVYSSQMGKSIGETTLWTKKETANATWCQNGDVLETCGSWPAEGRRFDVDKCKPGERGSIGYRSASVGEQHGEGSYSDDCVCEKDSKHVMCKNQPNSSWDNSFHGRKPLSSEQANSIAQSTRGYQLAMLANRIRAARVELSKRVELNKRRELHHE